MPFTNLKMNVINDGSSNLLTKNVNYYATGDSKRFKCGKEEEEEEEEDEEEEEEEERSQERLLVF